MGTKNNPGDVDCYANAEADEPMFVLLGRDPFAGLLVDLWVTLRHLENGESVDSKKLTEATACAQALRDWCVAKGKLPLVNKKQTDEILRILYTRG